MLQQILLGRHWLLKNKLSDILEVIKAQLALQTKAGFQSTIQCILLQGAETMQPGF